MLKNIRDVLEGRCTMQNKNQPEGVAGQENTSTGEHSFDELTKGLAEGTISRGRALKLIGASLLGGVGALSLFGGTAEARHRRHHHHRRRRGGGGGGGGCGSGCFRGRSANGFNVCVRNNFSCASTKVCNNDGNCNFNEFCITNSGCNSGSFNGVCIRQC